MITKKINERLCYVSDLTMQFSKHIKGEVSRGFDVISKPKNVCLSTETKNNCLVLLY